METLQLILKACRIGDLESLQNLLEKFPELIDETDNKLGWNGLYCSVMCGHLDITKYLLRQNANLNIKNRMGETPLHQAVECKNLKMIKVLLKHGADPNPQQNDGETPLHLAVSKGNYKIVCLLLENKANPNIANFVYGKTPVHYAVESGNTKIFLEILKYNPNMYIRDKSGYTPEDLGKSNKKVLVNVANTINPETAEAGSMTLLLSPTCTRCNSDISIFTENKSIDTKIRQIEMMNKKIRETVRSSVETIKRLDGSGCSLQEIDYERTESEAKSGTNEIIPELYKWLKSLRLLNEYELLAQAGYDDVTQLIKQMKTSLPVTEKSLINIGMDKLGHRRRLLFSLERLSNKDDDTSILSQIQCCLALPSGIWSNNFVTVEKWLEDLNLTELTEMFKKAGFEEVEDFMSLSGSPWALDDLALTEIGVDKPGYRHRILAKIRENSGLAKSEELVIEKTSNNSACELCIIM
ncbi:hypothetical protein SteCoe_10867 [Stentor coeruleus]|uniref:SAM domain-containing protein n=1 Tax=Stentor coeruleus TaxID=5963 RepID=A0A1R2CEJ2_9CILI|nr:hypothetical protein SteCoe_10867 [Stentor coeruleus]